MASVNLVDIYKSFDGINNIIKGINFEIVDGDFFVIVGPSGCGKTTILNIIAGLEDVTHGNILINGANVTDVEPKDRNIAMVFQNHALYPHLTVRENLSFALKIKHANKHQIDHEVSRISKLLGLSELLKRKPHQLSGGQKQRVAIGRAIIRKPLIFLMDEPLSNLDANLKSSMRDELKQLHRDLNATFVYVTHDQIEAMSLATKIIVMNEGEIQQMGTPYEIFMNPENFFVAQFMGMHQLNFAYCDLEKSDMGFSFQIFGGKVLGILKAIDQNFKKVIIAIRPEGFEISKGKEGLSLEIISSEVLGVDTLLKCEGNNDIKTNINVLLPTHLMLNAEKELYVKLNPSMIMIFNADTMKRIHIRDGIVFKYV